MRHMSALPRRNAAAGARRGAKQPLRRRAAPRWMRSATVWFGVVGLIVAPIAASAAWLWSTGRVSAALDSAREVLVEASASAGFRVREIKVSGRHRVPRAAVAEAVAIGLGEPLVAFDPAAARHRLEALAWVREATVERRFPGTVLVRLTERTPLALWQRDAKLVVVDRAGAVIGGVPAARFARLPVIVGDDAPAHAANLLAAVAAQPTLGARVRAAVRIGGRRWNIRLDNGIDVKLPENGIAEAWRRLAEAERRHGLLDRGIVSVDLRLPDRLVIQRAPAAHGNAGSRT